MISLINCNSKTANTGGNQVLSRNTGAKNMSVQDIRWVQRFNHFKKAYAQLKEAVDLSEQRKLSKLEEQGLIQAFEYTHELAWKVLRDFLEEHGAKQMYGSKDVTRESFKAGLIENGEVWMKMIESRNLTSHTYNEETATEIVNSVIHSYTAEFSEFYIVMHKLEEEIV